MAARTRFPTGTVMSSKCLVPCLAAEGPLAYSPAEPPDRDYFFQYIWILPEIFDPRINLREHRYFGSPLKQSARFLFDFWAKARSDAGQRCNDIASSAPSRTMKSEHLSRRIGTSVSFTTQMGRC
jgi:hypothetical protein